ncbi:hypothetical protein [Pseudomonas nitroreducens]|uniref:hypothetical protein n=1 Tax=Pseudomonas nitroreducens TaxID=46680 RepID=UPI00265AD5FD|nr:hypothetical protein [Pseudomonas nitroreducens]MCP1651665.1 hypothetical protein [Pseudomonas nitroreducens]MCP1684470.1 hypothetical protein [Pseudomonas nitroreducens]
MSAPEFDELPEQVRERISALAKQLGWSIDRCLEELLIEGVAMGGLTYATRPKAKLVEITRGSRGAQKPSKGGEDD